MLTPLRNLLSFLLCLSTLLPSLAAAAAAVTIGDAELDDFFSDFVEGKQQTQLEALERLAASDRVDTRELLQGIFDGDLMLEKSTKRVVRIKKQGRNVELSHALTGEVLGVTKKRRVKRLPLNNQIRSRLRALIAGLGLNSDNVVERRAAVQALVDNPNAIDADQLATVMKSETDADILALLNIIKARKNLQSDDPVTRLLGVQALADDLSADSRRALSQIAKDESADETVRKAAIAAGVQQQRKLALFDNLQTLFFGLSLGSVLVLAAIGLAISFGVMGVINMAHGELIMLGAYTTWALQQLMPGSLTAALLLSIPAAFILTALVGILIERGVIQFLYGRPLETLLATFGISLILQQAVRTLVSPQNVPVANPEFMSGVLEFNSAFSLTLNRLWIIGFCLAVFAILMLVLKLTRFGLEMRAVAQNRRMARAMGVRSSRIDSLTFGLGAGIAGIAGVALSQITNVGPNLGQAYIVDSFMVVVFGGVGNLWGTLIGGMTLGVANKVMEPWAGAILAKILVLVFLILFIQKRPRGLFPKRGRAAEGS